MDLDVTNTGILSPESKNQWIEDLIKAEFALMPLIAGTKTPFLDRWTHLKPDPTQGPEAFPDNYGIILHNRVLVLDVDPKMYADGDDAWLRMQQDLDISEEDLDTYIVRTRTYKDGREGLHIYFSVPDGLNLWTKNDRYIGVEGKTYGAFLVGPGSIHPDTGKLYTVINGVATQLRPAPICVIDIFTRTMKTGVGMVEYTDNEPTLDRFRGFLATRAPAVQGQGGEKWTYLTAAAGRDFNLSEGATFTLMLEHWNGKCQPPWTPKDLQKKVHGAYLYSKDAQGNRHPEAAFDRFDPPPSMEGIMPHHAQESHQVQVDRKAGDLKNNIIWVPKGPHDPKSLDEPALKNTLINVVHFFQRPHHGEFVSKFYNLVRYNTFSRDIEYTRKAPWHSLDEEIKFWDDTETVMLRTWFSRVRGWDPPEKMVLDGVIAAAQFNKYHPVIQYFQSLTWDRVPRLDKLMPYYCGTEDNAYTRDIGRCLMVAIIARVMNPGCQHDHLLILEGAQGTGKSTWCRTLGKQWYADMHLDPHNKDSIVGLLGKAVVELSEMTYNRKSDVDALKRFFSQVSDRVRLPYGKMAVDLPRQCVFIATTNATSDYLRDQTGNRRFWPVKTGTIRNDEFRDDLDQLYAEAYYLWSAGANWHLTDPETLAIALEEQTKRAEVDIWVECLENWLARELKQGRVHPRLSTTQITGEILNLTAQHLNNAVFHRVANTMMSLGWEKTHVREDGVIKRGYRNPHFNKDLDNLVLGI